MTDIREEEMQHQIDELQSENQKLKQQVAHLQQHLYGRKSEKKTVLYPEEELMNLFDEAETEAKPSQPEPELTQTVKEHQRKKKKVGHRKELLDAVPHEKVVIDLTADEKSCPVCGSELSVVGETYVRSEIKHIPAQNIVVDYYQKAYECRHCRQEGTTQVIQPAMPQPVVPHSYTSPTALAHIMVQKYQYALPLYRQEQEWKQYGIPLSRSTMANWILIAAQEWLYPLVAHLHQELLKEPLIHADETPVQVHKEKGRKNTTKSYMWVYTSGVCNPIHPIRLFDYHPSRSKDCVQTFLGTFSGYLQTDDYAAYGTITKVSRCLCWAHARRKFLDAKPLGIDDLDNTIVKAGIDQIGALFAMEKELAGLSPEKRKEERLRQEKPLLEAFWLWAESYRDRVLPKSKLSTALNYALSNKAGLEMYLTDGRCSISNNLAENSIRPFTIGRKNWLFSGSPKGARASAAVYSLIETCKANQVNAEQYLTYIFERLPNESSLTDSQLLENYMPWQTAIKDKFKA